MPLPLMLLAGTAARVGGAAAVRGAAAEGGTSAAGKAAQFGGRALQRSAAARHTQHQAPAQGVHSNGPSFDPHAQAQDQYNALQPNQFGY